ncbi:saccharopine dehydrogenase NADP-binding domain-containing protein [Oscillatoria sp. FACHB-1406]|nr:saccharopine dehydrogenase NADP-binding domain-containing protein [Oscillatoria sp. FACHB-1406]MBD2580566.1 saccharopine dehydrogenase NADP-binding domain-containing protein [Oscillatoria sp. FACHB-1406]
MSERPYHIILYGASGFVGRQTVHYLARQTSPERVTFAIAGRNRQKLEAVRDEVGATVDILVADCQDRQSPNRYEKLNFSLFYDKFATNPHSARQKVVALCDR